MNFLIPALGANLTFGLISTATSATNSAYTLIGNISRSTSTGAEDIILFIKGHDLEMKIKITQYLLCEVKIDDNSPITLKCCVKSIQNAIEDIGEELGKIKFRMEHNDNLWIGKSFRGYNFHNCKARLAANISTLELRYNRLLEIISIQDKLYKNNKLMDVLSESIMEIDADVDTEAAEKIRDSIHKKLEFCL